MSDIEPQQANHPPGDTFSRSSLHQQHNHGSHGAQIFHAANNDQLGDQRGDVPLATRRGIQSRVDPHHVSVANHSMAVYHRLPVDPTVPYTYPNPQGFPEHEQVILPENQGNNLWGYGPQPQDVVLVPDPNQLAFLNPPVQQAPALGQPVAENLRRLASRYVHHPDSQVDLVRMEPGPAGRYRVVIVLEISDFL